MLKEDICASLTNILDRGFIVGIVTGRGHSVRKVFQQSVDKKYWKNIIIGYYNGSDIGTLDNDSLPDTKLEASESLKMIEMHLNKYFTENEKVIIELRPAQITIKVKHQKDWIFTKRIVLQLVNSIELNDISILESNHSIDIIDRKKASKLNILEQCTAKAKELGIAGSCLCIGDKGQWPGNDYLLLSTPYSLSVDEVSALPDNCWNIADVGIKNTSATLEYLSYIIFKEKHMIFKYK